MDQLKMIFRTLGEHKFKFVLMLASVVAFGFLLFPFDDLGDLVSTQVSKLTNNQVFVQFDRMKMGVVPNPGLQLQNVYLETTSLPPLTANEITFTPSISGLIAQKPSGSLAIKGFLKGNVTASLQPAKKSDNGVERHKVEITAQQLNLADIKDLLGLPLSLKGRVDLNSQALADLTLTEQPDMDLVLHIDKFELPTGNVQTPMGPLTLPEIKLKSVDLKGRLSAGRFIIEEGVLGQDGDELKGTVRGSMALQLKLTPQGLTPLIGSYEFMIDLTVKPGLQERATLFLSFLDQYKFPAQGATRYAFKLSAANAYDPPNMGALR
jgi:type II secretion system protein N